MASIGIQCGGRLSLSFNPSVQSREKSNMIFSSNLNPSIPSCGRKIPGQCLSASLTSSNSSIASPPGEFGKSDSRARGGVSLERIDSWMKDSVEDIVRNLNEAPLLVQIYADGGASERGRVRFKTEKALMERWPEVKSQWETGESRSPDGLIFVDELEQNPDGGEQQGLEGDGSGVTRAWGLVVQGKGVECDPACYLLKTNRVCAGMGLGSCTHFCLMKVNNFRDSALEQFRASWLLQ